MDKLQKALDTIALGYSQGNCSIDKLIKACNSYKIRKGLVDDFDYEMKVAKSCIDSINGVEQDAEIAKAIVPGQTKVVDGVMYVYSKTKSGSKTDYDWHVVRRGAKTNKTIGRGGTLDESKIKAKQKYINDLFPNDLSALKVVKTLGGSTGAKLVEDADGNQYVMKRGNNTNPEHVKSEYLSNQLYGILGLKTPDYELYDNNGEAVLLSRFIQGTHAPKSTDWEKMSKGFAVDVMLANWDVYQNDNCLVKNANGEVYRVDNGGCLDYRAQGKKKTFDGNVLDTWKSMMYYNSGIANLLDYDDQLAQIEALQKKRDDVITYLTESGEDELAKTFAARFDGLKDVVDYINKEKAATTIAAQKRLSRATPRTLKTADEMYAEFDDKQIADILDEVGKESHHNPDSYETMFAQKKDTEGWLLLSRICQRRGFDARPNVVSEDDFWKKRKQTKQPLMFRGFDKVDYLDDFLFNDRCHFGSYGIWGQGIYAHSDDKSVANDDWNQKSSPSVDNKSTKANYKKSLSYSGRGESAMGYSGAQENSVLTMCWEPDANVVNAEDLLDQIKNDDRAKLSTANTTTITKLKKELDDIKAEWTKNEIALQNIGDTIKQQVFQRVGYNEDVVREMLDNFANIDWGTRNAQGKRNYPMYDEFLKGKVKPWVEKCGGTVDVIDEGEDGEQMHLELGGSDLWISKYAWNNNAVKQKNQFTAPYHYQAEKFLTFVDTNYVKPANEALQTELSKGEASKKLKDEVAQNRKDYYDKKAQYDKAIDGGAADNIYGRIYKSVKDLNYRSSGRDRSLLGIYAALQGYDGIYQPDGNDSKHGFTIILNRSKIVTMP